MQASRTCTKATHKDNTSHINTRTARTRLTAPATLNMPAALIPAHDTSEPTYLDSNARWNTMLPEVGDGGCDDDWELEVHIPGPHAILNNHLLDTEVSIREVRVLQHMNMHIYCTK